MKYGLSVNSNETMSEIIAKSIEIEVMGFDYVWVADIPVQRYSPTVASAIAEKTSCIRIGLGLLSPFLHTPQQIANDLTTLIEFYGDRFELCLGPGDRDQLERVGIPFSKLQDIPEQLLKAKREITDRLCESKFKVPIWLGAQGPNILELSRSFDGVLLNYAHPDFLDWAMKKMNLPRKHAIPMGVYTPSYIYKHRKEELYQLYRVSSAIVALGASKSVLEKFGFYNKIAAAKKELEKGLRIDEILNYIPVEVADKFGVSMPASYLSNYVSLIETLGIQHAVFGYPQNFSLKTIRDLGHALFR